jgi:hypothetical protein
MDDIEAPMGGYQDRTASKCPWWLWLVVVVSLITGVSVSGVYIPEAYNDAVDKHLCQKQLSQIDEAFRLVAIIGGAGIGVTAAVFLFFWCFDSSRLGRMLLNLEASALMLTVLLWAVVFVAGTFSSHCNTAYQAEIWTALASLSIGVLAWMCCRQRQD